ncbi:mannitol-1-phosphate dehydrogenase [Macrolepiota fuliginosa MF-IS2]|uniref:alcohol dehydrogenase n=1 Tax=Macrolepiota fuliginosa MF-IS2 TaxID=1400762 RepID=A0A9P5X7W4_9AGAR|nr:mannitol-1-phosphate dehydrogenase [Macrolepiota fuliginosa MF-IS2]
MSSHSHPIQIPKTQKAAIVKCSGAAVQVQSNVPVTQPADLKPGECLVKLQCTGVCHTDLHAAMGDWPVPSKTPLIGGHEGVGDVVAIGHNTVNSPVKLGDRVGIKWIAYSCLQCEQCRNSREQNCEHGQLSGYTVDGTFQQYVVSYVNCVTPIPDGIESASAASLLCAGLTVYRALKYSETNPGDWVVLPGAGGGLGHLAIQYAKYMGRRVIAIDGGEEKRKLCLSLGADHWIDFTTCKDITAEIKRVTGGKGAHAAVVTTASSSGYSQAIDYLRENGRLMAVGLPSKATLDANIFFTVFKSITIHGSYVGNRQDAIECVNIAASGAIKVHYQSRPMDDLEQVYDEMGKGKIAGRIVLTLE